MGKKKFKYKEAMNRLNEIVYQMEHGDPDVDELSVLIKSATELLSACKQQLRDTEKDLNDALTQLEEK